MKGSTRISSLQTTPTYQPIQYGKFLLLDRIARGGMAELCRAKIIGSQGFEKLIAIKKILPHLADQEEFVSAFIDEARLAAFLQHRNIVQIFDFGEIAGSYFISMEYLSGQPLRILMNLARKNDRPLPLGVILFIVAEICTGLDYAHNLKNFSGEALNIIHRDIGPQNVFLTYDGQVKIIDFGIARATSHNTATTDGSLKGKVAYMSPEQAGGGKIDHRSDIFSVGIILYELATGRHLYAGEDSKQQLAMAVSGGFVSARQINDTLPPLLYEILDKALALEPDGRYQAAEQMRSDLEKCARLSTGFATPTELATFMAPLFAEDMAREEEALRRAVSAELPPADEVLNSGASPLEQTIFVPGEKHAVGLTKRYFGLSAPLTVMLVAILAVTTFLAGPKLLEKMRGKQESAIGTDETGVSVGGQAGSEVDQYSKASTYFSRLLADSTASGSVAASDLVELDRHAALVMEKSPQEAWRFLVAMANKYPNSARVHFQLGRLYTQRKETDKAMAAYQKAVSLDNKMDEAFFNLGYLYGDKKEYKEAKAMYAKVIELAPAYVDEALFNLALIEKRLGQTEDSIRHVRLALEKNPRNPQAARLYEQLRGKKKEQ